MLCDGDQGCSGGVLNIPRSKDIPTQYIHKDTGLQVVLSVGLGNLWSVYLQEPNGSLKRCKNFNLRNSSDEMKDDLEFYVKNRLGGGMFKVKENEGEDNVRTSGQSDVETFPQESVRTSAQISEEPMRTSALNVSPEQNKALIPYLENDMPYDRTRIIDQLNFLFKQEIMAKFAIGKGLIILREVEGDKAFSQILEENFPGLNRRRAYEYILFARKVMELPKIKEFADGGGNWKKALLLLETCDENELKQLEVGEPIAGKTLDEIDKMSYREVKTLLRGEREESKKIITAFVEERDEAREEAQRLAEELKLAKEGHCAPERAYETLDEIQEMVEEISIKANGIPFVLARQDMRFIGKMVSQLTALQTVVNSLVGRVMKEAGEEN